MICLVLVFNYKYLGPEHVPKDYFASEMGKNKHTKSIADGQTKGTSYLWEGLLVGFMARSSCHKAYLMVGGESKCMRDCCMTEEWSPNSTWFSSLTPARGLGLCCRILPGNYPQCSLTTTADVQYMVQMEQSIGP